MGLLGLTSPLGLLVFSYKKMMSAVFVYDGDRSPQCRLETWCDSQPAHGATSGQHHQFAPGLSDISVSSAVGVLSWLLFALNRMQNYNMIKEVRPT